MNKSKNTIRLKRHWRLRKNINGTAERPRLNVFRSLNNIYAQVIDDVNGVTLVAASSLDKELKDQNVTGGNAEGANELLKKVLRLSFSTVAVTSITAVLQLSLKQLVKLA